MILPCFCGDYSKFVFGGSSIRLQPTPLDEYLRKIGLNDVVPGREVPFGNPDDYILYLDP